MEIKASPRRLRFGRCTLDEGRGVLRAPDGTETLLRPKTYDLLRLLLRHGGCVVSRNEILDAVWPGLFVTDDSITQCVVELRRAMGEAATLLRTMPRRGYLLEADALAERDAPPTAAPALSPLTEDRPSIVVLPFRAWQHEPEDGYLCDGIIEGIVHVLSGLEGLSVLSRGTSLAFAAITVDARAAGRELGVRHVLHGGLRRAGGRLEVMTELSETSRGTILRRDHHAVADTGLFALQDRIAADVAASILPRPPAEALRRALRRPPASLHAYDLVLRALDRLHRVDRAALAQAEALLHEAMAAEPDHALPCSCLAWLHLQRIAQGWSANIACDAEAASLAAAAAMERDGTDARALAIRGLMLGWLAHDLDQGAQLLDRAVAARPSSVVAWTLGAELHVWRDDAPRALCWAERALRLAPFDPCAFHIEHVLAQAHYTAGDFAAAVGWARRAAASNPLHAPAWRTLVASLVAAGRLEDAAGPARRLVELDPGFGLGAFAARTPLRGAARDLLLARLRRAGLPD